MNFKAKKFGKRLKRKYILFMAIEAIVIGGIVIKFFVFPGKSQKITCDGNTGCKDEAVIVLHGLVRSSTAMNKIAEALNKDGYTVCNIQYPSRKYSIAKLATNNVYSEIQKCLPNYKERSLYFVTHSMGGIITRQLANDTDLNIDRVVMLSPPNQGSELVDKLKVIPFFKLINGEAGLSLGTEANSVPNSLGRVNFATGIITGDRSLNPFYSYLIPGADDGKVSVASAKVSGMKDFLVVPHSHSFIMDSPVAIEQTIHFLNNGEFKS